MKQEEAVHLKVRVKWKIPLCAVGLNLLCMVYLKQDLISNDLCKQCVAENAVGLKTVWSVHILQISEALACTVAAKCMDNYSQWWENWYMYWCIFWCWTNILGLDSYNTGLCGLSVVLTVVILDEISPCSLCRQDWHACWLCVQRSAGIYLGFSPPWVWGSKRLWPDYGWWLVWSLGARHWTAQKQSLDPPCVSGCAGATWEWVAVVSLSSSWSSRSLHFDYSAIIGIVSYQCVAIANSH